MNYTIKFGTDGWREIIANQYTVQNVIRVTEATAQWLLKQHTKPSVSIGYDCRFGGRMFAEYTAACFAHHGIKVFLSDSFVTTPMLSLANTKLKTQLGVVITASHNPASYNGFKLKADYGGPLLPSKVAEIERLIPPSATQNFKSLHEYAEEGLFESCNMEKLYIEHVTQHFNLSQIHEISSGLVYDAMYGAGQSVVKKILPNAHLLHCSLNPSFNGIPPEPILKNLKELSGLIEYTHGLQFGLATDGDADRIGFFDSKGQFIDSHHLILLVMNYLVQYKKMSGAVVKSFSVSNKVERLASKLGLKTITTQIGFKYICEYMVQEDVLIGAEESGGIAIKGHIPERDGIWIGLTLLEYMAVTGKSIEELIQEIYSMVGPFAVERYDLSISQSLKDEIINNCKNQHYTAFGGYKVLSVDNMDGYKFHLPGDEWVMIRPSGTEPVLRVYAESFDSKSAYAILDAVKDTILQATS